MVQFAPRVVSIAVVREHAPAYGLTQDGFPPGDEASGDESDVIEALGDEIATLAAHIHAATFLEGAATVDANELPLGIK